MRVSWKVLAAGLAVVLAVGAVAFALGRATAPTPKAKGDYFAGLRAGEAQGRQEGRALQAGAELPGGERDVARRAFDAGYAAGANDVFAGYDGGWTMNRPWIVTLDPGTGRIVYRIDTRERIRAGVNYYLCPDGRSLCQQPRK
jgi:hypothetical protein